MARAEASSSSETKNHTSMKRLRVLSRIIELSEELGKLILGRPSPSVKVSEMLRDIECEINATDFSGILKNYVISEEYLRDNCVYWKNKGIVNLPVVHSMVYSSDLVAITTFTLPKSNSHIPLHDHPGMHGFLKVLRGKVKITSYSVKEITNESHNRILLCKSPLHSIVSASDNCAVLTANVNNVHYVEAVDDCATFVDVLVPNYDPQTRDCLYYKVIDNCESGCKLKQIQCPTSFYTVDYKSTFTEID